MTPTLYISGLQDGVDKGALIAAKACGKRTGGEMPRGFLAHSGEHPEYAACFGATENPSREYPPRTRMNVFNSHGTLRIAVDFNSPGEKRTMKEVLEFTRPWFDIRLHQDFTVAEWRCNKYPFKERFDTIPEALHHWLNMERIETLNCAGNSEKNFHGIEVAATRLMTDLIQWMERKECG